MKNIKPKKYLKPRVDKYFVVIHDGIAASSLNLESNGAVPEVNNWINEYEIIETKQYDL